MASGRSSTPEVGGARAFLVVAQGSSQRADVMHQARAEVCGDGIPTEGAPRGRAKLGAGSGTATRQMGPGTPEGAPAGRLAPPTGSRVRGMALN